MCPGGIAIYAIIRAGGKQYRVEPDRLLDVDLIHGDVGSTIELTDVLLIGGDGEVQLGTPVLEGARVIAEIVEHGRDKKLRIFKYKAKTRYRRHMGHRQDFTRLAIRQIVTATGEVIGPAEKPRRAPRRVQKKRPEVAAEVEAAVEAPQTEAAEAAPKPRRARAAKAEMPPVEAAEKPARRARATRATPKPKAEAKGTATPAPRRRAKAQKPDSKSGSDQ